MPSLVSPPANRRRSVLLAGYCAGDLGGRALRGPGVGKAEFPETDRQMKGVMAVTAVLVVITIGIAIHTSAFIHS